LNRLHEILLAKKIKLALAESCTGGAIAAEITKEAGCSTYFLGAIVCYSNHFKEDFLRVPKELISQHGAVSEEVALALVQGLFLVTEADIAAAVTGIAGPTGGSPSKPVGTVWIAVGRRGEKALLHKLQLHGTRHAIIEETTQSVLDALLGLVK